MAARGERGDDGRAVAYGVRPEHLTVASASDDAVVPAHIVVVEPTGAETELLVQAGGTQSTLVTPSRE